MKRLGNPTGDVSSQLTHATYGEEAEGRPASDRARHITGVELPFDLATRPD